MLRPCVKHPSWAVLRALTGCRWGFWLRFTPLWLLNGWRYYKEEEEDGVVLSESSISDVTRD